MLIVGLSGKMGSGKSAAVKLLKEKYPKKVKLLKFAAPLYEIQDFIYKTIVPVHNKPKDFVKDRKLLQFIGTDWGRTIDPQLWIKMWVDRFCTILIHDNYEIVVCDDVRFDNEAAAIKKLGGIIVEIESTKTSTRINTKAGIAGHSSEDGIDLKYVDYIIENNGSLRKLGLALEAMLKKERV